VRGPSAAVSRLPFVSEEPLRRTLVGGYSRRQVDEAMRERDERLEQLEAEAQQLARRVIESERRMRGGEPPDEEARRSGAIAGLTRRLEEAQDNARRRAGRIRVGAQDAMALAERARELSTLRDELSALVGELASLAGIRMGGGGDRPAVGTEAAGADRTYSGIVQVEVGPLRDFAQLTSFEDAVAEIDPSSTVQVRNFAGGRATFSMSFAQPVELVRELEERTPFPFSVRSAGAGGVVLDVATPDAA
jgi:hypothetical protein